MSLNTHNFA
jgi:hypothetical protein